MKWEPEFSLVKILKDYGSDNAVLEDLTRLAVGEIAERDLLGSSCEQEVAARKLSNRNLVLEAALVNIRNDIIEAMGDPALMDRTVTYNTKQTQGKKDDPMVF